MAATLIPVTLVLAAGLAFVNLWLTFRVGQVRRAHRVMVGDGGVEAVTRRMRAHGNFAENAPLVALLVLAIELAQGTSAWLWAAAALFLAARVVHALGMDGWVPGRAAGTGATLFVQIVLAVWAVAIPLTAPRPGHALTVTLPIAA